MENKYCNRCKETKPVQKFNTRKVNGKTYYQSQCRKCRKNQAKEAGWTNPDTENERKIRRNARASRDRTIPERRAYYILQDTKNSDRKKGLLCDLTNEYVTEKLKLPCHYCGDIGNMITLDRIDNRIGHVRSNLLPACVPCNLTRGDMPYDAWVIVAKGMKIARKAGLFDGWLPYGKKI